MRSDGKITTPFRLCSENASSHFYNVKRVNPKRNAFRVYSWGKPSMLREMFHFNFQNERHLKWLRFGLLLKGYLARGCCIQSAVSWIYFVSAVHNFTLFLMIVSILNQTYSYTNDHNSIPKLNISFSNRYSRRCSCFRNIENKTYCCVHIVNIRLTSNALVLCNDQFYNTLSLKLFVVLIAYHILWYIECVYL